MDQNVVLSVLYIHYGWDSVVWRSLVTRFVYDTTPNLVGLAKKILVTKNMGGGLGANGPSRIREYVVVKGKNQSSQ